MLGTSAALPSLALGRAVSLSALLGAAFDGALGFTIAAVTSETALQIHVPKRTLARVNSISDLLSFATVPSDSYWSAPVSRAWLETRRAGLCRRVYRGLASPAGNQ